MEPEETPEGPEQETPAEPDFIITEENEFEEVPIEGTGNQNDESERMQNEDEREPSSGPLFEADQFINPRADENDEQAEEQAEEPVLGDEVEEDESETGPQENDKEDDLETGPQENDKEDALDEQGEEVAEPTGTEPEENTEVEEDVLTTDTDPAETTEVADDSTATKNTDKPASGDEKPKKPKGEHQEDGTYVPTKYFFDDIHDHPEDPITTEDNATNEEVPDQQTADEAEPTPAVSEEDDAETETETE